MDYGEHLGIGIDSTVIIPKGYKPLAGGRAQRPPPEENRPTDNRPRRGSQRDALLSLLRGELARGAVFSLVFAPLDHRQMANGKWLKSLLDSEADRRPFGRDWVAKSIMLKDTSGGA